MTDRIFTAAVIIIGNEILSGRTQDTNLRDIAITLGQWGIRIGEARVIPDVEATIVEVVNELRARYDYVLTTGGIGPTHDDITAECIAKAFGLKLVEHPDIAAMIRRRESPPHIMASRLRMALVPEGAGLIDNSTGGPPGFYIGNVYVMAGIPHVMRAMLATLASKLVGGAVVQSRSVTVYLGESAIAEPLRQLQEDYPGVELGSYPFTRDGRFGTTLVARSTNAAQLEEVVSKLSAMIIAAGGEPQLS
jgi:molybdenum cofactor synthesis domain-containing protein